MIMGSKSRIRRRHREAKTKEERAGGGKKSKKRTRKSSVKDEVVTGDELGSTDAGADAASTATANDKKRKRSEETDSDLTSLDESGDESEDSSTSLLVVNKNKKKKLQRRATKPHDFDSNDPLPYTFEPDSLGELTRQAVEYLTSFPRPPTWSRLLVRASSTFLHGWDVKEYVRVCTEGKKRRIEGEDDGVGTALPSTAYIQHRAEDKIVGGFEAIWAKYIYQKVVDKAKKQGLANPKDAMRQPVKIHQMDKDLMQHILNNDGTMKWVFAEMAMEDVVKETGRSMLYLPVHPEPEEVRRYQQQNAHNVIAKDYVQDVLFADEPGLFEDESVREQLKQFERFYLVSSGQTITGWHEDHPGVCTECYVRSGVKLFCLYGIEEEHGAEEIDKQVGIKVELNAGDRLVMMPGTKHAVYTPVPSICHGSTFFNYHVLSMALNEISKATESALHDDYQPVILVYLTCMLIALASYDFRHSLKLDTRAQVQVWAELLGDAVLGKHKWQKQPKGVAKLKKYKSTMACYKKILPLAKSAAVAIRLWDGVGENQAWKDQ